MPVTMDDIKWWHWIIGAGIMVVSAIFGAGMASQKFLSSIQSRILNLERNVKSFYKDDTVKFMTIDDFRREQHSCQIHMAEIFAGVKDSIKDSNNATKESIRNLKESFDKLNQALIEYLAKN